MLEIREFKWPVAAASGKLHKNSNTHFRHFHRTGKTFACEREENYQYTRTEEQYQMRKDFGNSSHEAAEWLRINREADTPAYRQLQHDFDSQTKYTSLFAYLRYAWQT